MPFDCEQVQNVLRSNYQMDFWSVQRQIDLYYVSEVRYSVRLQN